MIHGPINKIEVELSSRCNAACPGCLRTILQSKDVPFEKIDLDIERFFERFAQLDLSQTQVKLCGVLGDPLMHPQLLDFVQWLVDRKAQVEISTNGGLGKKEVWAHLGKISGETNKLKVLFSVDGLEDTNAVYRVNTRFETIVRNMQTYTENSGKGLWIFIEFDHNSHQKEEAKARAEALGFDFFVRRAIRNSFPSLSKEKKSEQISAVSEKNEHRATPIAQAIEMTADQDLKASDIRCKYKHDRELFISAEGTIWPCCFLWDEYNQPESKFREQMKWNVPQVGWNNIKTHNLEEILHNPFYQTIENMWASEANFFVRRCFKSCGAKGKLQNSFSEL